jgi:hypothetical protein
MNKLIVVFHHGVINPEGIKGKTNQLGWGRLQWVQGRYGKMAPR